VNLMLVRRLAFFRPVWLCLEHAQPFRGDLESAAPAYQPPSSNHVHSGLHAANRTTAARVVDPTGSGNEVSVEPSLTQRSDPRLVHERSSTSGMMVPKQEAHVASANVPNGGPVPSRHVVILPRRITIFLSRCVKTHGLRTVSGAGVVSPLGARSPHYRDPYGRP
jgi:hypothetical protein